MALSDLAVFSEYAQSGMTEVQAQQVNLFNQATQGGLVLIAGAAHEGDYSEQAFWQKISGLVRRRNAYGSGAVAAVVPTQTTKASVKVASGTPPVRIDPSMLKWIQRNPQEAGVIVGKQMAEDNLADQLNTAIAAFVAGVGAVAGVNYDGTAAVNSLASLNSGAAKFGDRSQDLVCWLMHSKSQFDIYGAALANANNLFSFGGVKVVHDGFGRPIVVTDSANLFVVDGVAAGVNKYFTMGLVNGALLVEQNNDFTENVQTVNGDENIIRTYQAEWSYNLGMKGFTWDKVNGGHSPTAAALATATNWDRTATSDKDLAGVLVATR